MVGTSINTHFGLWGRIIFPNRFFYFTVIHNSKIFKDITPKVGNLLITSSTCEWLFVALFFLLVGWCLGVRHNLISVLPLYVVAQVLGVLSMIPGRLVRFDLLMMLELSLLGVSQNHLCYLVITIPNFLLHRSINYCWIHVLAFAGITS